MLLISSPPPLSLVAMGMDKSGTQLMAANALQQITGFTIRSGFPDTALVGNSLVVRASGSVLVSAKITINTLGSGSNLVVRQNGVTVFNLAFSVSTSATLTDQPLAVAHGDLLTLWFNAPGSTKTIQAGATNTYLYFTPA